MWLTQSAIETILVSLISEKDTLTQLDVAIGDGDHGANIERGCRAVQSIVTDLVDLDLSDATHKIGYTLLMSMGGASGALFGTFFLTLGRKLSQTPDFSEFCTAFENAIQAVQDRGKSEQGQKTLLDVLIPTSQLLLEQAPPKKWRDISDFAMECANNTKCLEAKVGRASFLGKRSVGHIDPGAYSCALIIHQICDLLEVRYE